MKKITLLSLAFILVQYYAIAQDKAALVADQNPNYRVSMEKYFKLKDSVNIRQGTTADETYTAIDPLEEKRQLRRQRKANRIHRRQQRRQWRQERRMARIRNPIPQFWGYDYGYNFGRFNNFPYFYDYCPPPAWLGFGVFGLDLLACLNF